MRDTALRILVVAGAVSVRMVTGAFKMGFGSILALLASVIAVRAEATAREAPGAA